MHRIPLFLATPSVLWERNLPECALFERTLNKHNVEETDAFLTILDLEANFYKSQCYGMAEDMFYNAQRAFNSTNSYREGMLLINAIILQAPKDSYILAWALKIRGNTRFHDCSFQQALNDFEMFLEVLQFRISTYDDICEVYGHLVICTYMMRHFSKVKKYFRLYKKYKVKIENHIGKFINEIDDIGCNAPTITDKVFFPKPHKGFTDSADIPAASSACYYKKHAIYASDDIPKASVVFLENPVIQSLNVPFLQCEVCYRHYEQQIYACLECRYKAYCSLSCLEKDKMTHRVECVGYKQLTLLVLDACGIYRTFIQISTMLDKHIFNSKIFRKLKTAEDIWDKLLEVLDTTRNIRGFQYLALIKLKPYYTDLSDTQYSTLIATAFRLTIFIDKETNLIETYFKKLHTSNKQKLILVGCLLMRIHGNMLLNTFDFEIHVKPKTKLVVPKPKLDHYSINNVANTIKFINSKRELHTENFEKLYNIDIEKEIWQRAAQVIESQKNIDQLLPVILPLSILPFLQHVQPCNPIHRILSTYKDIIVELCFSPELMSSILYGQNAGQPTSPTATKITSARIADMEYLERCLFVKKFAKLFHNHYTEFFLQLIDRNEEVKQVLSLHCPTLSKFQHSCVPNVDVIVLDNGVVIGKALRNIKKGEQLYVNFKAHYMHNFRMDREMFLRLLDVKCECQYCQVDDIIDEPMNLRRAIYCESCEGIEITPAQITCPICHTQYNSLLTNYSKFVTILENYLQVEIMPKNGKAASEREIYLLHLMMFFHCKKYFPPRSEFGIMSALRMAHYFAFYNYAHQAHILLKEVRKNILKSFDENIIWFTFYDDILLIIKMILCYNLEEKKYSISSSELLELCNFALHITNGQKDYIQFYEVFDKECSYVLEDISILLKWKETILCIDFLPLADSLNKSEQKDKLKLFNNNNI